MRTDQDGTTDRRLDRSTFLKLGAAAGASGILAGCGASSGGGGGDDGGGAAAEQDHPPIQEEKGDLNVFEWAGYELASYPPLKAYTGERGYPKPKYTFLTSDDQALSKVRAGFETEVVH